MINDLKTDLLTQINENSDLFRKSNWRVKLLDENQVFLRSERNSNNVGCGTANPSYDIKSENSSNYLKSVAAFSA